ncbi:MAG: peptidoglycan D,D-transpeptidase FtsI family protein [Planctomycetota bacterium]
MAETSSPHSDNIPQEAVSGSMRCRAIVGAGLLSVILLLLGARLAHIQIQQSDRFRKLAQQQNFANRTLSARRGNIYDQAGRTLATSVPRWSVFADPAMIDDPTLTANLLSKTLDLSPAGIRESLQSERRFLWIRRQVPHHQVNMLRRHDLDGIHFRKEYHRQHPPTRLFGHVVGFTDIDGRGISGAELQFDGLLRSTPGEQKILRDALGRTILRPHNPTVIRPENGYDIQLTVDAYVQHVAREALNRQVKKHQPDSAWAVVMDVQTGAVLAMVNHPEFNPNSPTDTPPDNHRNRITADSYEFGSVMKPITVAAALEEKLVNPETIIPCHNGAWRIGRRLLRDVHGYDELSVSDVITYSSNIGAAHIGLRLGPHRFYTALTRFGFGQPAEINLPGVRSGILRSPERWNKHSNISISFGQEISSSPLAVANAFAALANGGLLMRPHVLDNVRDQETGKIVWKSKKQPVVRRVISKRTSVQVMRMLRKVVTDGTGERVQLKEFPVAGKTGTASLPRSDGRGYSNRYLGSFVGIAPSDNPRIVALVSLKNPTQNGYYGGLVAGPACRKILLKTLRYLNVPERVENPEIAEVP